MPLHGAFQKIFQDGQTNLQNLHILHFIFAKLNASRYKDARF
ncbi:MAG: hypothetical protein RLZZ628_1939 [Bacteroidota bacterium]|jgi:hypothetical protein